jgi:uncharacterized DUF497 family protein
MNLEFEWDPRKAQSNLSKHAVSFDEGRTVFGDRRAVTIDDTGHSSHEVRRLILGRSTRGRLLALSFTVRDERIRVISVRMASRRERRQYEEA